MDWEGWYVEGEREQTWEPFDSIKDCHEKLHSFYSSNPMPSCLHKHHKEACRCHLPVYRLGQDESIFKRFLMSVRSWTLNGICTLRTKTEGACIMISGFVDEIQ